MALPKSVHKINKKGIQVISNVDAAQYTIKELSRAALKDVAKLVRKEAKAKAPKDKGNLRKNIATWVKASKRSDNVELQIGVYDNKTAKKKGLKSAFYAMFIEFGTKNQRARPFLKPAVYENIDKIRDIQAQYLSGIENESKANRLIDEREEEKND